MISYIITHISSSEYELFATYLSAPKSIFNQSRWHHDKARLQTLVYTCIKFESSSSTPSYQTRVHKVPSIKRDRRTDGRTDKLNPTSPRFHGGWIWINHSHTGLEAGESLLLAPRRLNTEGESADAAMPRLASTRIEKQT